MKWYEYLGFIGKFEATKQTTQTVKPITQNVNLEYSDDEYIGETEEYDSPYSLQNTGSHL